MPKIAFLFPAPITRRALVNFRLISVGYLLLTLTLVSGLFFSEELFGQPLQLNQKNVFSVAAWVVFGIILVMIFILTHKSS